VDKVWTKIYWQFYFRGITLTNFLEDCKWFKFSSDMGLSPALCKVNFVIVSLFWSRYHCVFLIVNGQLNLGVYVAFVTNEVSGPSIKAGTCNIPEHRIIMTIMRKICQIKPSKIKQTKINWYQLEIWKDILLGRERWVFLELTTMSAGSSSFRPVASRGITAQTWTIRTMNAR